MISPVIFILIFGLIEFSRLLMVQHSLANATREACRVASLASTVDATAVDARLRESLQGSISGASDTSKVRVFITPSALTGMQSEDAVNVRVEVTYSDITWLPGNLLGLNNSSLLRAESQMERE